MKKLMMTVCVLGLLNLTACTNTMEGVGKDFEKAGDSIKKSVDRLEKKFANKR